MTKSYIEGVGCQIRLYHTKLTPKEKPAIATICIIHGFGEHSGRFRHVAESFVNKDYEVLLVDLRGFGYSGGARGCSEIDDLQKDVLSLIK
jgi:alpha-beta hydrolase superfamily lysophospholipase